MPGVGLFLKGSGSLLAAALALGLGVLKGPPNPASRELLDLLDRFLDKAQGGLEYNQNENRYFKGIFAPTQEELPDGPGLELQVVEGALPRELEGVYLRIGPNAWAEPTKRHHVFDGDGMLHTVRLRGGKAFYHNAYLKTPKLKYEQSLGRAYMPRIGELHGPIGLVKAMVTLARKSELAGIDKLQSGTANTGLAALPDGRLWALMESNVPFEFQLTEEGGVATVGFETAQGRLTYPVSAHPKLDVTTGDVFFHGYSMDGGDDKKTFMKFGRFGATGELRNHFALNASGVSFSHDMVLSEHYAVVLDSSVRFSPKEIVSGGSAFTFDPALKARLGVVPRNASSPAEVTWFETPESLAWVHPLHAWEEKGGRELVIWAPLGFESARTGGVLEGCCDLWYMSELRLDLHEGKMAIKKIDPDAKHHGEFSRMRDDLTAAGFARFGYTGLANATSLADFDFIGYTKWDMKEKKAAAELLSPKGWIVGEPIFIPRPNASGDASDDGFLASFLFGPHEDSTDFVLYDARSFSQTPVVRLRVPRRVPVGFHGSWLGEAALTRHLARASSQ